MTITINGSGTITGATTMASATSFSSTVSAAGDVTLAGSGVEILNNSGNRVLGQTGSVIQVLQTVKTDTFSTSSTTFVDATGLSVSITPTSSSSKILIFVDLSTSSTASGLMQSRIMRNSTAIYIGDAAGSRPLGLGQNYVPSDYSAQRTGGIYLDSPATTSAVTYKIQVLANTGTQYINRTAGDRDTSVYDARSASSITVMEIAQ